MTGMSHNHTGVFVVRAWTEKDDRGQFRARITFTPDIETCTPTMTATDSKEALIESLSRWLDSLTRRAAPPSQ
jgi:hypothetical protein